MAVILIWLSSFISANRVEAAASQASVFILWILLALAIEVYIVRVNLRGSEDPGAASNF